MRLEERLLAKGGQGREAIGREGEKERLLAKRGKAERPLKKEDEVESLEEDMRLWEAKKDRRRRRYLGFRLYRYIKYVHNRIGLDQSDPYLHKPRPD